MLAEVWVPQQSNSRRGHWFRKKKPRRMTGLKTSCMGLHKGHSIQAPPVHIRGPTRPNWGGGRSLFGYNFLGHDARSPARCAKPRPALRLTTGRVGAVGWSPLLGRAAYPLIENQFAMLLERAEALFKRMKQ